jgi:hypothetical protein
MDYLRLIAGSISLSKEIRATGKLKARLRFECQNPFKWFN